MATNIDELPSRKKQRVSGTNNTDKASVTKGIDEGDAVSIPLAVATTTTSCTSSVSTGEKSPSTPTSSKRLYLACPYSEKDLCKRLGGKFDFVKKKWYVDIEDCETSVKQLARWLDDGNRSQSACETDEQQRKRKKHVVRPIIPSKKALPPPTDEQLRILCHKLVLSDFIAIIAAAGTGKTTTLQMLSKEIIKTFPKYAILYCAFNKAAQEDAARRFGGNVVCKTLHGLAFRWFRDLHGDIPIDIQDDDFNNFNDVGTILNFNSYRIKEEDAEKVASFTWKTMINFCFSADDEPNDSHVVSAALHWHSEEQTKPHPYAVWAKVIFNICRNPTDSRLPLQHDIYLKECQLAKVQLTGLRTGKPFDIVMLDEAQDVTQCQVDLIRNQYDSARLFIGDPHQSIYQFRGADYALEKLTPTLSTKFKLRESL